MQDLIHLARSRSKPYNKDCNYSTFNPFERCSRTFFLFLFTVTRFQILGLFLASFAILKLVERLLPVKSFNRVIQTHFDERTLKRNINKSSCLSCLVHSKTFSFESAPFSPTV